MEIPAETKMSQDLLNFPEGLISNYCCNIYRFQFPGPVLRPADPRTQQGRQTARSFTTNNVPAPRDTCVRKLQISSTQTHTSDVFLCLIC